jgi:hypothetical protein
MLFLLASWIFLGVCGAPIGAAIFSTFKISAFQHLGDRAITAIWLGVMVDASLLLGLSVFLPLTPAIGFCVLVLLAAISLSLPGARRDLMLWLGYLNRPVMLGLGFLSLSVGLNSTRIVEAYDTALYHYQFVRWLSQYGTVRGFALLQERFATSSSWFALAAPFDFGPFQGRVAGLTGGLAMLLCFVHFAFAVHRVLIYRANRADWFLIGGYGLVIPICLAWTFEVSLSPDLPIWILTVLVGWLMLLTGDPESAGTAVSRNNPVLPLLFAAGAFTVKLSGAITVLIAGIFYLFSSRRKWFDRIVLAICGVLISIPVFLANVISSACPLYPNALACLNVPWGVGKAAAKAYAMGIRDWARWGGPTPSTATDWNWIVPWFLHADRLLLLSACGLCLVVFLAARGWRGNQPSLYIIALMLFGTGFVFLSAPNPRFGAGYLALSPALVLARIGPELETRVRQRLFGQFKPTVSLGYLLAAIAILLLAQGSFRERSLRHSIEARFSVRIADDHDLSSRLVLPPRLASSSEDLVFIRNRRVDAPSMLELTVERYNGIDYRRPVGGDQCWGAVIPCLPRPLEGDIHLRDPNLGLRAGFTRSATAP